MNRRWKKFYKNQVEDDYQSPSVGTKGESKGHRKRDAPLRQKVRVGVEEEGFTRRSGKWKESEPCGVSYETLKVEKESIGTPGVVA